MSVRVLIADCSPAARDVIRQHLECGGCEVVAETETARQAIDLFRTTRPHVVTLDVGLRSTGGYDTVSVFRTIRRESPETSIVIVNASRHPYDAQVFIREGALDFAIESFDSYTLELMWRRLSEIYPELKRSDGAASGR
ncbi:MAG: response regulator [Candidatus Binatus sp.]|uniref:response regulator n=1 Tax=Candidatus Binatus sp. TaxID=2811406 RepID=UPI0027177423|nr:response regulator [Candidatus Binatus sp.]MDO8433040.1 response regulator [Candidatus Binatus sp.]